MAANYSDLVAGTNITWTDSGGDKVLNMKNLTTSSIRQGDKSADLLDATKGFPELLEFSFFTKLQVAPTAGNEFQLFVGFSSSTTAATDNPAGLGGADATGPNVDALPQLTFVGSIICSNNIGTGLQQQDKMYLRPKDRYIIPVAYNNTGQTTTNVSGDTKVVMTPWYRRTPIA